MKKTLIAFGILASFAAAGAQAQTTQISLEPRAGLSIPTGDMGDDVEVGLALTGDVIFQATPQIALYAGYNYNTYAFKDTDGVDAQIKGFDAGVRFSLSSMSGFTPFLKGGVLYQKAAISGDGGSLSSDNEVGFQVGGGVEVPISPRFSFTPQLSFNKVEDAQYVNIESGLRIRL
ncbi:MAG TPA: outer membrane beta-barrel protein [Longimicrobium sp.]|nr:outer membrane beta-barrel protein [Longimicrobium sp.]